MFLRKVKHNLRWNTSTEEFDFPINEYGDTKKAKLVVFVDEKTPPHFHVSVNGALYTSIRLDSPRYYFHGDSNNVLTRRQFHTVYDFLLRDPFIVHTTDTQPHVAWHHISTNWEKLGIWWCDGHEFDQKRRFDCRRKNLPKYYRLKTKEKKGR